MHTLTRANLVELSRRSFSVFMGFIQLILGNEMISFGDETLTSPRREPCDDIVTQKSFLATDINKSEILKI